MNRRVVLVGVAAVGIAAVGAYAALPGADPTPELAADFDAHADQVRVLALLSPT